MAVKTFSKSAALTYGWKKTKTHFKFLIVVLVLFFVASALPGFVSDFFADQDSGVLSFIAALIGWALQITVSLGLINVVLKIHDGKKTTHSDLFKHYRLIIPYVIGSVIYSVIVFVGFLMLVIPGIIWAIKFQYFSYLMVDRGMGPIDALKESAKITEGVRTNLFFLKLLLVVINIVGMLFFVVGLLVTIPLSIMAEAYVYRKLYPKK